MINEKITRGGGPDFWEESNTKKSEKSINLCEGKIIHIFVYDYMYMCAL